MIKKHKTYIRYNSRFALDKPLFELFLQRLEIVFQLSVLALHQCVVTGCYHHWQQVLFWVVGDEICQGAVADVQAFVDSVLTFTWLR